MNTPLLQRYLDGRLTHEEEVRLRLDLQAKAELTAQERAILLLLSVTPDATPIDESWWSEEGCETFDAILAEQADFTTEKTSETAVLSDENTDSIVPIPLPTHRKKTLWPWSATAAVVIAMGVGGWWYATRDFSDEIAHFGDAKAEIMDSVERIATPKPIAKATLDETANPEVQTVTNATAPTSRRTPRRTPKPLLASTTEATLSPSRDAIALEMEVADFLLEQEYQKYRKAEELRFAMLRLDLDYLDYCREQEELSAIETIEL